MGLATSLAPCRRRYPYPDSRRLLLRCGRTTGVRLRRTLQGGAGGRPRPATTRTPRARRCRSGDCGAAGMCVASQRIRPTGAWASFTFQKARGPALSGGEGGKSTKECPDPQVSSVARGARQCNEKIYKLEVRKLEGGVSELASRGRARPEVFLL